MRMSEVGMLASSPMLLLLLSLLMASFFDTTAGQVGVCYGEMGNNLPSNEDVVAMYKQYKIQRMRMYDVNSRALNALRGSNIELILDIPNHKVDTIAKDPMEATKWVRDNVQMYNNVRFRYISVGNEVKPDYAAANGRVLIQAMENIDRALSEARLSNIKVSTTTYMGAFTDTYPPSRGRFKDEYRNFLQPVIDFLVRKQSPLLVNIYTFFSYNDSKEKIPLQYALFTQTNGGERDNQYTYKNLFDATLDSAYAALEKSGGQSLEIVVSETGWPTKGGFGASVGNATIYINQLIKHVKNGTPRRPGAIETYIFAMFNEENKGPQEYEKYWGLFFPDKQPQIKVTNGFN